MDLRLGLSTTSRSATGWVFHSLKQKNEVSALKNRLLGDAEMHKGFPDREHLKTVDGVKYSEIR